LVLCPVCRQDYSNFIPEGYVLMRDIMLANHVNGDQ